MRNRLKKRLGIEALEGRQLLAFGAVSLPGIHFSGPTVFDPLPEPNERLNDADFVDLNGDGQLDVVFLHNGGVASSIFENGEFSDPMRSLSLTESVWAVETGDVDNDGLVDAVVRGQSSVSVLHGESTNGVWSGFRLGQSIKTESNSMALGDVNQDGNLDMVLGNKQAIVYTGNGVGEFSNPVRYGPNSQYGNFVSLGDADNDGDLDLLNGRDNSLDILRNDGGIFEVTLDTIEGDRFGHAMFVDMNEDGSNDLWLGNSSMEHSLLNLFHGNGDGTFLPTSDSIETLGPVSEMRLSDMNNDGIDDVVAGTFGTFHHPINGNGSGGISVILATETGTYHPAIRIATPTAFAVSVSDVDGDGALDVLATHYDGFSVHRQANERYFLEDVQAFDAAGYRQATSAVGDLNSDSHTDYVLGGYNGAAERSEIRIYLGNATGTYDVQTVFVADPIAQLDIANFDGNLASNELAVVSSSTRSQISLFGIDVDGMLTPPVVSSSASRIDASVVADMNGDEILDYVSTANDAAVWLGSAGGAFAKQSIPSARSSYAPPIVRDFNDDQVPDIATTSFNGFDVLIGNGDGSFQIATQKELDFSTVVFGYFDGDAIEDVAYAGYSDEMAIVEFGQGDGTFSGQAEIPKDANTQMAVADLNNDGRSDILYLQGQKLHAYMNAPDAWQDLGETLLPDYASIIQSIDIDGDGLLETIITAELGISIPQANFHVINDLAADGTSLSTTTFSVGRSLVSVSPYDINGDGADEIIGTAFNGIFVVRPFVETSLSCDFDKSGGCDVLDLDALLYQGLVDQSAIFDLDDSGTVDLDDRDEFFRQTGTLPGDVDFSGIVDATDLNILGVHWLSSVDSAAKGDVNGDGVVDAADLNSVGLWWLQGGDEFAPAAQANMNRRAVARRVKTARQHPMPMRGPTTGEIDAGHACLDHNGLCAGDHSVSGLDGPAFELLGRRDRRAQMASRR